MGMSTGAKLGLAGTVVIGAAAAVAGGVASYRHEKDPAGMHGLASVAPMSLLGGAVGLATMSIAGQSSSVLGARIGASIGFAMFATTLGGVIGSISGWAEAGQINRH